MEKLFQIFSSRVQAVDASFRRYLWYDIDWKNRLIAITGARGAGKTPLQLQYIKETFCKKYTQCLLQTVNQTIESDFPAVARVD